jgi:integrase
MASIYQRGDKLWARLKESGKWVSRPTPFAVGQEREAKRYAKKAQETIDARTASGAAPVLTVRQFATTWLAKRTNVTASDDSARIANHVAPRIGSMPIADVKPKHIDDVIMALRDEGKLAPRTIRSISGLMHTMFKRALKEELIVTNPVQMERGILPKKVDKDPTWRHEAIYTRTEAERLLSDPRILLDRRVLYALKFLAGGLRHSEAARLTWAQYDADAKPLGRIALGKTKSGVPREVPVHPTLAKVLAAWKLSGWNAVYGRTPTAEDFIVPTRNMNTDNPRGTARDATEAQRQLLADLELLGLRTKAGVSRKRRGHDLRRTFITLARTDGAIDGLLRWITHGPSSDMMDVYSSPPWEALCTEVAKLKISLLDGALMPLATELATAAGTTTKRWRKVATPTGRDAIGRLLHSDRAVSDAVATPSPRPCEQLARNLAPDRGGPWPMGWGWNWHPRLGELLF